MLNKIIFAGRITADPELKSTGNQVSVVSFSVAVERNIKDKDGNRAVDFIPVTAWRHTAEFICKYFRKGQMILILGELQSRKYEDKDSGKTRTAWEVIASEAHFCGGSEKAESGEKESGGGDGAVFEDVTNYGDDLPF